MNLPRLTQNNSTAYFQSTAGKFFCEWIKHCVPVLILQVCLFVLTSGAFVLAEDSGDALYIDENGHVGIGKNDPKAALDVSGTILGIGMVPPGGIIMYHGDIKINFDEDGKGIKNTPCEGWQLCNGNNGTPDLQDRFVLGLGPKSEKYDKPTGGEEAVKLTIDQMPAHNHGANTGKTSTNYRGKVENPLTDVVAIKTARVKCASGKSMDTNNHSHTIASEGKSEPHNNMPPYYVLAYIMKLPEPIGK